jgi:hypothetical protein
MSGGYQTQVYNQEAQAVAGDFASANPRATTLAGPGGLIAGPSGVTVGSFVWLAPPTDPNGTNQVANNFGSGNAAGFVYNDTQALNTVFLSDATMVIPQGLPVSAASEGDFWVVNNGTTEAEYNQKCYANLSTGLASFAATASPTQAASATSSSVAAATSGFTASIAGDIMTVTAVSSGTLYLGTTVAGTGVASNTLIAQQLTGTRGSTGTYLLSVSQQKAIASEAMTGSYGVLTIGTLTTTPVFAIGQTLTVSGAVVAGTVITDNISGTGGSGGTMVVTNNTVVSSQTISTSANVETKFVAKSAGAPGALIKISSWSGTFG